MVANEKLFLLDAMSLIFRAFFAPMQMALMSPSGMPTKAIYIFVRTLRKLLKDHSPSFVGVAFDLAAPTFRDKLFEEYKANRPEAPEDLIVQLPYVRRFCQALGVPIVEKEGFEADDVIGTLAKQGRENGFGVFIVSGDEDLFQLVDDRVCVLKPARGGSEGETICDAAKVKEILGVEPSQVVDWLALTGDPSDNIPGCTAASGEGARSRARRKKAELHRPQGCHRADSEVWHAGEGSRQLGKRFQGELSGGAARLSRGGHAQPRAGHHSHRRSARAKRS